MGANILTSKPKEQMNTKELFKELHNSDLTLKYRIGLLEDLMKPQPPPVYKGAKDVAITCFQTLCNATGLDDKDELDEVLAIGIIEETLKSFTHQASGKGMSDGKIERKAEEEFKKEPDGYSMDFLLLLRKAWADSAKWHRDNTNPEPRELPTDNALAKWMHDQYEEIAKQYGWDTQKSTKVEFKYLPDSKKSTMHELARRINNKWLITNPMQQGGEHVCANFMDKQGICCVCEKQKGEWTQDRVRKAMDELGFQFPETEEQLKAFDEKFKDYPHRLTGNEIDPLTILNSITPSFHCAKKHKFNHFCDEQCGICKKVESRKE